MNRGGNVILFPIQVVIFINYPLHSLDLITLIIFILFQVLYKLFGRYGLFDHGGLYIL